jgi:hypothetical protein
MPLSHRVHIPVGLLHGRVSTVIDMKARAREDIQGVTKIENVAVAEDIQTIVRTS